MYEDGQQSGELKVKRCKENIQFFMRNTWISIPIFDELGLANISMVIEHGYETERWYG